MAKDDDGGALLVLGGGVAAASVLALAVTRRSSTPTVMDTQSVPGAASDGADVAEGYAPPAWVHPVPSLGHRAAVTSNPFRAAASAEGRGRQHLGADLMYRRKDARDLIAAFPVGSPGGTPLFFMPEDVPVFAASAGVVVFAGRTATGNTIIVAHDGRWATYYTHLATLAVRIHDRVTAGATLGTIGASPQDAEHLRHLHLELWRGGTRAGAVDPDPFLATWPRRSIAWVPTATTLVAAAPRNGSMTAYRAVGERGDDYPAWVRNLRGESGVYVIREIGGPVVYVGSSIGRLYDTLTRHFQTWRRWKSFWKGQYAQGHDPGLTYPRGSVEVAIKLTSADDAHEEELRLIRRLEPRDNLIGQREDEPELEAAPF